MKKTTIAILLLFIIAIGAHAQGLYVNVNGGQNSWLLHNPEPPQNTSVNNSVLYLAPGNNNTTFNWAASTQFRRNGDVLFTGKIGTNGLDPIIGLPAGSIGGVHTQDVYAEHAVGVGTGGALSILLNNNGSATFNGVVTANGISTNAPIGMGGAWQAIYGTENMYIYGLKGVNLSPQNGVIISKGFYPNSPTSGNLTVEGELNVRSKLTMGAGQQIYSPGRLHIDGAELLYILNNDGVRISKSWHPNSPTSGNLTTEGTIATNGLDPNSGYPAGVPVSEMGIHTKNIMVEGGIAIGDQNIKIVPGYRLFVQSGIITEKVRVAVSGSANWADYVFDKNYQLPGLDEVENFINANNHLPNIPSAKEVVKDGINLGEMDAKLLSKIEELTLYVIEVNKKIAVLETKLKATEKNKTATISAE